MVLLSFLLVLAAAVTLVIGLLNGGLGLIYVSIASSLAAGVVLTLAVLRSRPRPTASGGPAPIHDDSRDTVVTPSSATVRRQDADEPGEAEPATRVRTPVMAGAAGMSDFPVADYDNLKVTEILPLLPELEPDELEVVRAHESNGKNRSRVLGRIEMLSAEQGWDAGDDEWEPTDDGRGDAAHGDAGRGDGGRPRLGAVAVHDDDLDDDELADDDLDDLDDLDDDDLDAGSVADLDDSGDAAGSGFPIADYEDLKVGEIMPLLPELDADELEMVREREERGAARGMILSRVERLLGGAGMAVSQAPAAPSARKPARKTAGKKVAAGRARTPATRTPATGAPTKKRAIKATPVKAGAAKAGAAKSGGVKAAPARAGGVKRAPAAKKAAVKKAGAAKRSPVAAGRPAPARAAKKR